MTFTDIIGRLKKKDQHRKLKRLNTPIGNLFPQQRQTKNFENSEQRNNSLQPLSIMTMSDLSKSISNRSITFASVFDEPNYENNNHTTVDPDPSVEDEDLVIVVPNKYVLDEPIINNSNIEPYPFRSEIPLSLLPKSYSSASINRSSYSRKKPLHYHRPKKLRHPLKTIPSINSIDRSKSTPNLLTPISTSNDHHRSLKTFRQWFKSSSVGRLIQSLIKHPTENTNTKHFQQKSSIKSIPLRKYSDLIY